MSRRCPLALLSVLCVASAGLLVAACGGSSPSSTDSSTQAKEQQAEVKNADFAKCLREHGIEATAATGPGGQGHGLRIKGTGGPAKMEAAQSACKKYQPEPQKLNLSPQEKVAQEEAVQKFAKCMREHGVKVEATTKGGGIQIAIHAHPGEAGAPNPESPAFQKAQNSCQKLLPKPPLAGAKAAPGGPPPSGTAGSAESGSFATGG